MSFFWPLTCSGGLLDQLWGRGYSVQTFDWQLSQFCPHRWSYRVTGTAGSGEIHWYFPTTRGKCTTHTDVPDGTPTDRPHVAIVWCILHTNQNKIWLALTWRNQGAQDYFSLPGNKVRSKSLRSIYSLDLPVNRLLAMQAICIRSLKQGFHEQNCIFCFVFGLVSKNYFPTPCLCLDFQKNI